MKNIVSPKMDVKTILTGEMFDGIVHSIEMVSKSRINTEDINDGLRLLANHLRASFGIDTEISILDEDISNTSFFGISIFPGTKCLTALQTAIVNHDIVKVREIWQTNRAWVIEIDSRLIYDYSCGLNNQEIATLILFSVENVLFNYNTIINIVKDIVESIISMPYLIAQVARSNGLKFVWAIPIVYGCARSGFSLPERLMRQGSSMITCEPEAMARYSSGIKKLTTRYGSSDLMLSDNELSHEIHSILNWMFEGINDMKISSHRFIHKMQTNLQICPSPYIRTIYKSIITNFVATQSRLDYAKVIVEGTIVECPNPMVDEMNKRMVDDRWKKYVATIEAHMDHEFIDRYGFCKKVTKEEIDMCLLELGNVASADDKIYLMERLYVYISTIDYALEMLNDKDSAKKVKQRKEDLIHLKQYANEVRMRIIAYKIQPERYGLYIKYPAGYEG